MPKHMKPTPPTPIFDVVTDVNELRKQEIARNTEHYLVQRHLAIKEKHDKEEYAKTLWNALTLKDVETVRAGLLDICEASLETYKSRPCRFRYKDIIDLINEDIEAVKSMSDEAVLCAARMYLSPPAFI